MRSLHFDVHRRGGVAATHDLLSDGYTSYQLSRAVHAGEIVRVRQGHYACPELSAAEREALRVGGRLTGTSGARHYGIWAPLLPDLEIAVPAQAKGLRTRFDPRKRLSTLPTPTYTKVAWRDRGALGTRTALLPIECLEHMALTQSSLVAFAAVESALNTGRVSRGEVSRMIARLPASKRGQLAHADRASESGGESLFRFQIMPVLGDIMLAQQVRFVGIGDTDFLIGERLVVEIDGYAFHRSPEAFEEDRRRDAALRARGYRVLRFSYKQVESRWDEVAAAVASAIAAGDHLAR